MSRALILDASPAMLRIGRANWRMAITGEPMAPRWRVLRNGVVVYEGPQMQGTDGPLWPGQNYIWQAVPLDASGAEAGAPTDPVPLAMPWPTPETGGPVLGLFVDFPDDPRSAHRWAEWDEALALATMKLAADTLARESRGALRWDPVLVRRVVMPQPRSTYMAQWDWKAAVLKDAQPLVPDVDWTTLHRMVMDVAPNGEGGAPIPGSTVDGRYCSAWLTNSIPASNLGEVMHEDGHTRGAAGHSGGNTAPHMDWITPGGVVGYYDPYCYMGANGDGGFNAGWRWRFGWLAPGDFQWTSEPGVYDLAPTIARDGRPTVLIWRLDPVTLAVVEYRPGTRLHKPPLYQTVPALEARVLTGVKLDRDDTKGYPGGLCDTVAVNGNALLLDLGVSWSGFGANPDWAVTPLVFGPDGARVRIGPAPVPPPPPDPKPDPLPAPQTAPTVQWKNPLNGAKVPHGRTVDLCVRATGAVGVSFAVPVMGMTLTSAPDGTLTATAQWRVPKAPNHATHTLAATAYTNDGQHATAAITLTAR